MLAKGRDPRPKLLAPLTPGPNKKVPGLKKGPRALKRAPGTLGVGVALLGAPVSLANPKGPNKGAQ